MANKSSQAITIDGVTLQLTIELKSVKNINARLNGKLLAISAPHGTPQPVLDDAAQVLGRRLLRRVRTRQLNADEDALEITRVVARRFTEPPEITQVMFVATQEARWGSYSTGTGIIRLHAALREMPRWVLEAVVAHELAHIFHHDHSPAFWKLLHNVCPETPQADAFLAGVSWLANRWESLPPIERSQLMRVQSQERDL